MVNLNTVYDRNQIWENKSNLKKSNIFINEDLPRETERRRAEMFPILKKAKSIEGYKKGAYMIQDKLMIDKKKYTLETINTLPNDLNPHMTATQEIDDMTFFFTKYSVLSNHYRGACFELDHNMYCCTEQRYFSRKADFLGDKKRDIEIMATKDPKVILDAGKKIENFSGEDWEPIQFNEMLEANRAKFSQNGSALMALLNTESTHLAECCPGKSRWGIGYSMDDPARLSRKDWGTNLQGQVLEILRNEFRLQAETPHEPESMEDNTEF
jgi:ribA/ribD-fused uncharacterized protein